MQETLKELEESLDSAVDRDRRRRVFYVGPYAVSPIAGNLTDDRFACQVDVGLVFPCETRDGLNGTVALSSPPSKLRAPPVRACLETPTHDCMRVRTSMFVLCGGRRHAAGRRTSAGAEPWPMHATCPVLELAMHGHTSLLRRLQRSGPRPVPHTCPCV